MSSDPALDEIAYRILGDRKRLAVDVLDDKGWLEFEFAVSALEPGYAAVRTGGSDPVTLTLGTMTQIEALVAGVRLNSLHFPAEARPCEECSQVEHAADCYLAPWDPTDRRNTT